MFSHRGRVKGRTSFKDKKEGGSTMQGIFFYRYEGTRFRIKGFSTYHAAHDVVCVWMYLTAAKKKKPGTLRYIYRLYRGYHKSVRVVIKT